MSPTSFGEPVAVSDSWFGDALGDAVGFGDALGVTVGFGDALGVTVGFGDTLGVTVGFGDALGDTVGFGDTLGSTVGSGDALDDALGSGDALGDTVGVSPGLLPSTYCAVSFKGYRFGFSGITNVMVASSGCSNLAAPLLRNVPFHLLKTYPA